MSTHRQRIVAVALFLCVGALCLLAVASLAIALLKAGGR